MALKSEFKKFLGDKEIFKFVKDVCEVSHNILLIIDGDKEELPEIVNAYSDTWGKIVKIMKVKRFTSENEVLVCVEPDFMNIQNPPVTEDVLEMEHNTPSQLAMMAAELSYGKNSNISISQAAKTLKVSRDSAHIAKRIMKASPQLAKLVKFGTLSLHAARMKIEKPTEQN